MRGQRRAGEGEQHALLALEVLVEDGTLVSAGDLIAVLSNTNLQLEVLSREAAVTEQLNNMRTIELQLEQNRLSHKRNLVEIDYQIIRLTRSIERQRDLAAKELVSKSTLDELQDELSYYENRRDVTLESQATDARLQEQQLEQLRTAGKQLEESLALARQNLEDLNIRAPIAGKLSGFNIEVGQSIERGGRRAGRKSSQQDAGGRLPQHPLHALTLAQALAE